MPRLISDIIADVPGIDGTFIVQKWPEDDTLLSGDIWLERFDYSRTEQPTFVILFGNGDYGGWYGDRANIAVFADDFEDGLLDWWWHCYGSHGYTGLVLSLTKELDDNLADELYDWLKAIEDYPIASDDKLSQLEDELEQESWDNYLAFDVEMQLSRKYDFELPDDMTSEELHNMFLDACSLTGDYGYFENNGTKVYPDFDEIVEHLYNNLRQFGNVYKQKL